MTEKSQEMSRFLDFIKNETGKKVKPFDAIFDKSYAKFRHLPYQAYEGQTNDEWKSCIRERTWINVILHEGMTDSLRNDLFPHQFDLGNTSSDTSKTGILSDLLNELNIGIGLDPREMSEKLERDDLNTVINGIKNTLGYDLSSGSTYYPVKSLKVIKLMQNIKKRKPHLFGLIKTADRFNKPSLDFRDTAPDPINESDSLLLADLISYLSIEIPKERLKVIHTHIPSSSKLTEIASEKTLIIAETIRIHHKNDEEEISETYKQIAKRIEKYTPKKPDKIETPLDEELYIYLITLELQHFSTSYEKLLEHINTECSVKNIKCEIEDFCITLSEQFKDEIRHDTKIASVKSFTTLVSNHKKKFWKLAELATGLETRSYIKDEVISHAQKVLSLYNLHSFDGKNIEKNTLSISDCIAAICTVVIERNNPTKYEPFKFGQKSKAKSPLFYFDKTKSVEEIIETDCVPHSINQLMYRNFNNVYHQLTGDDSEGIRNSFLELYFSFIKRFAECLQHNNIENMILSEIEFERFITILIKIYTAPKLPETMLDGINIWMKNNDL